MKSPALNLVVIGGNVTKQPDLRYTPSGAAVLNFGVANNRPRKDKSTGEWVEDTTFIEVTVWGASAERLSERIDKGEAVIVTGTLTQRSWEKKDGTKATAYTVNASRVDVLKEGKNAATPEQPTAAPEDDPLGGLGY